MKRWIIGIATVAIMFAVTPDSHASLVTLNMGPYDTQIRRDGVINVGALGLWLGEDFDFNDNEIDWNSPWKNWEWTNTKMEIFEDGDALISGTMTRMRDQSTWGIQLRLMDMEIQGDSFRSTTAPYAGMVADLMAGGSGASIEWDRLRMRLFAPYETAVPLTGWRGYRMPQQGHPNPAELKMRNGQLYFGAWYRNANSTNYHYRVGDTKSHGGLDPVPEPTTALLVGLGLLVAGGTRLRRRT